MLTYVDEFPSNLITEVVVFVTAKVIWDHQNVLYFVAALLASIPWCSFYQLCASKFMADVFIYAYLFIKVLASAHVHADDTVHRNDSCFDWYWQDAAAIGYTHHHEDERTSIRSLRVSYNMENELLDL